MGNLVTMLREMSSIKALMCLLTAMIAALSLYACTPQSGEIAKLDVPEEISFAPQPVLSNEEIVEIFSAQAKGNWEKADLFIGEDIEHSLMGHILAQRYLHKNYISKGAELKEWLANYADLPQAPRIYKLAKKKGATNLNRPISTKKRNLSGYGESFRNRRYKNAAWETALNLWRQKKYSRAYKNFREIYKHSAKMGDWDKAAIAFWAYRSADAAGMEKATEKYLAIAAEYPRSFYGAQAVHLLGNTLNEVVRLRSEAPLEDRLASIESEMTRNALIRIDALIEVKQYELAKEELLLHYSRANIHDRPEFARFAQTLEMPAIQLRMGVDMERKGFTFGEALYPLPKWQPKAGYVVDPSLIFAIARQESGFNRKARSYSGAQGMMQLMPDTARYIAKKIKFDEQLALSDAELNIELGQNYLRYLAEKPYIKRNIIFLAAAYNAGPGNAKRWAQKNGAKKDPLYFVETIPFNETRDYVMNVMANYWMYREIMNEDDPQVTLLAEGKWPKTRSGRPSNVAAAKLSWPLSPRS
jgi:soluble lytic murein transglycosylase-like protein